MGGKIWLITACAAVALGSTAKGQPTQARSAQQDAEAFGARGVVHHISLSPVGDKIAYVSRAGDTGEAVYVVDLAGNATTTPILHNAEENTDITQCDWATNRRLVCKVYAIDENSGMLLGFSRLLALGDDGSDMDMLSRSPSSRQVGFTQHGGTVLALDIQGEEDKILMARRWVPEMSNGKRLSSNAEGLGVEEVDINTQRRRVVEPPESGAVSYIADETGRVRIKARQPVMSTGSLSEQISYFYRPADSDRWDRLSEAQVDSQTYDGFSPVAVDAKKDVVYGFESVDGYNSIVSIALDGSGKREQVMGRDDVDVDQLVRIGRQNRVVGASFATEKREVVYFDSELKALAEGLAAALPGKPLIDIVDANEDESKLLIIASSDVDPGMSYLYDKATQQLSELIALREGLDGRTMGEMRAVSFPAADGTTIPGYLTLPPGVADAKGLPAVVLPHGGPSARDEWGFDWLVQYFAARGYAVLQPNFRGSSGYGSAWFGRNGFQAWQIAVGDVNAAGRWLVAEGIAAPDRLAIVGWSYGGYAALQSQVLDPKLYKAVVAIAPVTDLQRLRDESRDFTNYRLVANFIGSGPHISQGSPAQNATAFEAPVMLVHGTLDQNVGVHQSRFMQDRLQAAGKQVEYLEFDRLDHQLDSSSARIRMLTSIDAFLARNFGE